MISNGILFTLVYFYTFLARTFCLIRAIFFPSLFLIHMLYDSSRWLNRSDAACAVSFAHLVHPVRDGRSLKTKKKNNKKWLPQPPYSFSFATEHGSLTQQTVSGSSFPCIFFLFVDLTSLDILVPRSNHKDNQGMAMK